MPNNGFCKQPASYRHIGTGCCLQVFLSLSFVIYIVFVLILYLQNSVTQYRTIIEVIAQDLINMQVETSSSSASWSNDQKGMLQVTLPENTGSSHHIKDAVHRDTTSKQGK